MRLKRIGAEIIDAVPGILFWASLLFAISKQLDVATWLLVLSLYFRRHHHE